MERHEHEHDSGLRDLIALGYLTGYGAAAAIRWAGDRLGPWLERATERADRDRRRIERAQNTELIVELFAGREHHEPSCARLDLHAGVVRPCTCGAWNTGEWAEVLRLDLDTAAVLAAFGVGQVQPDDEGFTLHGLTRVRLESKQSVARRTTR